MCKGDAHDDVEQWTIPADSKHLNSHLAGKERGFGGGLGWSRTCKHDLAGLWSKSDFEFLQKINAQNQTSYSCLQKTGSEHFALELDNFGDETPRGDWFSICSLEKGFR